MNPPTNYKNFCTHYKYNSKTKEAEEDYKKYLENHALFSNIIAEDKAKKAIKKMKNTCTK